MCRFRGRASVGSKNIKFVHKHNIAYGKSLLNMKICMCVHKPIHIISVLVLHNGEEMSSN